MFLPNYTRRAETGLKGYFSGPFPTTVLRGAIRRFLGTCCPPIGTGCPDVCRPHLNLTMDDEPQITTGEGRVASTGLTPRGRGMVCSRRRGQVPADRQARPASAPRGARLGQRAGSECQGAALNRASSARVWFIVLASGLVQASAKMRDEMGEPRRIKASGVTEDEARAAIERRAAIVRFLSVGPVFGNDATIAEACADSCTTRSRKASSKTQRWRLRVLHRQRDDPALRLPEAPGTVGAALQSHPADLVRVSAPSVRFPRSLGDGGVTRGSREALSRDDGEPSHDLTSSRSRVVSSARRRCSHPSCPRLLRHCSNDS